MTKDTKIYSRKTSHLPARLGSVMCSMHSRELDYKIKIVRLHLCLVRCLVAHGLAAAVAAMYYHVTALCIGLRTDRAQYASAFVSPISGVYIYV